jgi:glucose-1-phosphate cytidylyltransferase
MKAVILAGGYGTRISEESGVRPKPLVEIGNYPILWHIMKLYSHHGINEFIICSGYKGHMIKEYFSNYFLHRSNVSFDLKNNSIEYHENSSEPWKVTIVDTGLGTMTGGRLKQIQKYIGNETFCMTYGDGVADVDIKKLIAFHKSNDGLATLTAVQVPERFGAFNLSPKQVKVSHFKEKPKSHNAWVNGGFFILEPEIFEYLDGDDCIWEREPLEKLANENKLNSYRHLGFWMPMDTLKDKRELSKLWDSGNPPWKVWKK